MAFQVEMAHFRDCCVSQEGLTDLHTSALETAPRRWRVLEVNRAYGLALGFDLSGGLVQLVYSVEHRGTSDIATELAKAAAALLELDLHRHFRTEVVSAEAVGNDGADDEYVWRERRCDRNLGFKDEVTWCCSLRDSLHTPDGSLLVDFQARLPGNTSRLRAENAVGFRQMMTFRISPLQDESGGYRIECWHTSRPPAELYKFLASLPANSLANAVGGQVRELAARLRRHVQSPLIERRVRDGPRSDLYREIRRRALDS